jgi:type IV pilus assembly protein PilB
MQIPEETLKSFVIDTNLISRSDLEKLEKKSKEAQTDLVQLLVRQGFVSEDGLRKISAKILGIPFVNLSGLNIDFDTLSTIPEYISEKYNAVAFNRKGNSVEVAFLDLSLFDKIKFVEIESKLKVLPRVTDTKSIRALLLRYREYSQSKYLEIISRVSNIENVGNPLVTQVLNTLLSHTISQRASNIHIESGKEETLIRYRIKGSMYLVLSLEKKIGDILSEKIKQICDLNQKDVPQFGQFKMKKIEGYSFQVSFLPIHEGEKIVIKILGENTREPCFEKLGLHGDAVNVLYEVLNNQSGMVLIAGPRNSGKTTTLYSCFDILNNPGVSISTVEKPVDHYVPMVNQIMVNEEKGVNFTSGLRATIMQDSDIVMLGEIDNIETAHVAINASNTGHMILSSMLSRSVSGAIIKMINLKIQPFLIVSSLRMVVGQRLVKRLTGEKERYFLTSDQLLSLRKIVSLEKVLDFLKKEKIIDQKVSDWKKIPFYRSKAIVESNEYIGVYEVMKITDSIKTLIMKQASAKMIEEVARDEGMMTILEDTVFKCVQGITTLDEVFRIAQEA